MLSLAPECLFVSLPGVCCALLHVSRPCRRRTQDSFIGGTHCSWWPLVPTSRVNRGRPRTWPRTSSDPGRCRWPRRRGRRAHQRGGGGATLIPQPCARATALVTPRHPYTAHAPTTAGVPPAPPRRWRRVTRNPASATGTRDRPTRERERGGGGGAPPVVGWPPASEAAGRCVFPPAADAAAPPHRRAAAHGTRARRPPPPLPPPAAPPRVAASWHPGGATGWRRPRFGTL